MTLSELNVAWWRRDRSPRRRSVVVAICLSALMVHRAQGASEVPSTYHGTCDASAAVALGAGLFIVANDEDNRLRIYLADHPGPPLRVEERLYAHLGIDPDAKKGEADIEGGRVGR